MSDPCVCVKQGFGVYPVCFVDFCFWGEVFAEAHFDTYATMHTCNIIEDNCRHVCENRMSMGVRSTSGIPSDWLNLPDVMSVCTSILIYRKRWAYLILVDSVFHSYRVIPFSSHTPQYITCPAYTHHALIRRKKVYSSRWTAGFLRKSLTRKLVFTFTPNAPRTGAS